jgi:hypothetical protein
MNKICNEFRLTINKNHVHIKRLLLFFTISFVVAPQIYAQDDIKEYGIMVYPFDKNSIDPSSMSYLDTIVVDYNHFFMSEYHRLSLAGISMDKNLKKKFVQYLAVNKQLNKIVMEEPYSYGYWVNQYLQTGDTVLLQTFLDNYYAFGRWGKNLPEQIPEYYDFFKFVYELNMKHGLNIKVVGIDLSTSVLKSEFWTLKRVFEEYGLYNVYPESYERLQKLNKRKKVRKGKAERWLNDLKNEVVAENLAFTDVLKGGGLTHFNYLIKNLQLMLPTFAIINKPSINYRDSIMYQRYVELVQPDDVAFSQFGYVHAVLSDGKRPDRPNGLSLIPLATRVQNDPNFKNKCMSINLQIGWEGHLYNNLFTKEEDNYLRSSNNYEEVMLDFRYATGPYEYVPEFHQFTILINYFQGYFNDNK